MAVKVPGRSGERRQAEKQADVKAQNRAQANKGPRSVPRKAGHLDTTADGNEDPVAEPELLKESHLDGSDEETKADEVKRRKEKKRRGQQRQGQQQEPSEPELTAAHLVHDSNYYRSLSARKMGLDQTPGIDEAVEALLAEEEEGATGESLVEILPSSRARAHPALPEAEVRPPDFLTPMQAMTDIYMKVKGRASRRTKELLEGYQLEDLLTAVRDIYESERLGKAPEARILGKLYTEIKDDPGPLLIGLNDPRLTEVWRLFIDGWDIWVPEGRDDAVELFWEGEAEYDDGTPMEICQTLQFIDSEVVLHTRMGELEDEITFDGENFYRLKTSRAPVRTED